MKIDIHKDDLWWLREVLHYSIDYMESQPNPSAFSKCPKVARKVNRKLSRAIKKVFGHTMDNTGRQKSMNKEAATDSQHAQLAIAELYNKWLGSENPTGVEACVVQVFVDWVLQNQAGTQ